MKTMKLPETPNDRENKQGKGKTVKTKKGTNDRQKGEKCMDKSQDRQSCSIFLCVLFHSVYSEGHRLVYSEIAKLRGSYFK